MLHRKFVILMSAILASLAFVVAFASGPAHAATRHVKRPLHFMAYKYATAQVELVSGLHSTFGAHDPGNRIGWIRSSVYWHPTAYYRVRGAGRR